MSSDGIFTVSGSYFGMCYAAVGLWNATLLRSEKGFYAMSFVLALYAAVTVQKNGRDAAATASAQNSGIQD